MKAVSSSPAMLCLGIAMGMPASAEKSPDMRTDERFGTVLQTDAIVRTVLDSVPEQRCWKVRAERHHQRRLCETVARPVSREALVGYRVKYAYRGRVYHTETVEDPGERIRIDHGLTPTFF